MKRSRCAREMKEKWCCGRDREVRSKSARWLSGEEFPNVRDRIKVSCLHACSSMDVYNKGTPHAPRCLSALGEHGHGRW